MVRRELAAGVDRARGAPRGGPGGVTASVPELAASLWPIDRLGDAAIAVARRSGLLSAAATAPRRPPVDDPAALDRWLAATGEQIGVSIEAMTAAYREVDGALAAIHPGLVRIGD